MTSGCAAAAGRGDFEIQRHPPVAEFGTINTDELFTVAGMSFVTETAAATFPLIGYMYKMQVSVAVTEFGIKSCFRKAEQVLVMALQAKVVASLFVGEIQRAWITAGQHPEVIRPMGVMTAFAFSLEQRPVQEFLPFKFFADIQQRRLAQIIATMAA